MVSRSGCRTHLTDIVQATVQGRLWGAVLLLTPAPAEVVFKHSKVRYKGKGTIGGGRKGRTEAERGPAITQEQRARGWAIQPGTLMLAIYGCMTSHPNIQRLKNNKYLLCHAVSESQESRSSLAGSLWLRASWEVASKILGAGLLSCQPGMGWRNCFQAHSCAHQQTSRSLPWGAHHRLPPPRGQLPPKRAIGERGKMPETEAIAFITWSWEQHPITPPDLYGPHRPSRLRVGVRATQGEERQEVRIPGGRLPTATIPARPQALLSGTRRPENHIPLPQKGLPQESSLSIQGW